jgi:uncharacterized protein (TIGR02231 family)
VVPSKISKVTVYSQGAQIYRKSSYSISSGLTQVIIEGISPRIDPKSLQVKATGNVIILDSKYGVHYPEPEESELKGIPLKVQKQINSLKDSITDINFIIREIQDEIDVYVATKNILLNNGAIRGKGKVNDSIGLLKEAVDYYTIKMMEVNKKIQKLNRKKAIEVEGRNGMNTRLNDLQNYLQNSGMKPKPQGPVHRVVITLSADAAAKGKIDISYLVANAGWTPMYDLRSEPKAGKINLNYKAQVFQNTGIDWEDVRLNISTNNPYQNKTKPTLHPWYIDYYAYRQQTYKNNNLGSNRGRNSAKSEAYSSPQPTSIAEDSYALEELVVTDAITANNFVNVVDHVISAEFQIDLPYTIKSNNEQHMILVKNEDLKADFKYYTVPKYDASAYLVAELSKLDELQLVPAKANIFFDGSYIGETYLDPTSMEDTLKLSLGKDPNIIIKRTLLEHECKDKVVGSNSEKTFAYSIEVKNLKSTSIDLVVQDQIPVTTNPDIHVTAKELSKGKLKERTGLVEWEFTLKSKVKKDIEFIYEVKHPKDQKVVIP